jgi:uncharacterized Fe-S cluster-containing radical SAM superfamily enzyme
VQLEVVLCICYICLFCCVEEGINSRLKSRDAVVIRADLVSYSLLCKDTDIKIYRTVIVLLFCVGVKLGLSH